MLTTESIAAVRAEVAVGATLPYSWYTDRDVFAAERAGIFAQTWHYVGLVDRVASPGAVMRADLAGMPALLVRGLDGVLRGFHNVCRHRGSVLVREECGVRNTLQCHYHAWTYDLDGSLRAAPRSDRENGFDRGVFGLAPLAVDTWGPFLFAHPRPDALPLHDWLGEMPALVAAAGIDVDTLRLHHRVPYSLHCNWKNAVENFLECYHCAVAHPAFADVMDTGPDAYRLQVRPSFASELWSSGPLSASATCQGFQRPPTFLVRKKTRPGPCQCNPTRLKGFGACAEESARPLPTGRSRETIVASAARATEGAAKASRQTRRRTLTEDPSAMMPSRSSAWYLR